MNLVFELALIADGRHGLFDAFLTIAALMRERSSSVPTWWRWTCGIAGGITVARLRSAVP